MKAISESIADLRSLRMYKLSWPFQTSLERVPGL